MAVVLGIVAFAVVVVVGMTWWFRRTDHQVRGRLRAVRHTGFVPPPPELPEADQGPQDFVRP
jgi:hypothetical protein